MAEGFVDLGNLGGEESAAMESGEMLQIRIFSEQPTEFLPGGLGLDEREVAGGELGAPHC